MSVSRKQERGSCGEGKTGLSFHRLIIKRSISSSFLIYFVLFYFCNLTPVYRKLPRNITKMCETRSQAIHIVLDKRFIVCDTRNALLKPKNPPFTAFSAISLGHNLSSLNVSQICRGCRITPKVAIAISSRRRTGRFEDLPVAR